MPVKYVDEKTGKLIRDEKLIKTTGAPSAYGIRTIDDLVKTSLPPPSQKGSELMSTHNVFFNKRAKL